MKETTQTEAARNTYIVQHKDPTLESVSGVGSSMETTDDVRFFLPIIIRRFGIQSIIDSPCGDLNWMRHVELGNVKYTGFDVVPEIIEKNTKEYTSSFRTFGLKNMLEEDLPKADLIICRDFLFHLSLSSAQRAINNIVRSGSTFLLSTTFDYIKVNEDSISSEGDWGFRKINLALPPFSFPTPLLFFQELHPLNENRGMGLWRI